VEKKANQIYKDKLQRHLDNLRIFTGFFHSKFFLRGIYQPKLLSTGKLQQKNKDTKTKEVKH
jgi:hypothetical protein